MEILKKGKCEQSETALHTHDIIAFLRCRRKWSFSSAFRRHLQPKAALGVNSNLWFGTGIHWALEDYHGYNRFEDPVKAFRAYYDSHQPEERPVDHEDLLELGIDMLTYYKEWERTHHFNTVWMDGKPLVEQQFSLVLAPLCYFEVDSVKYFQGEDSLWYAQKQTGYHAGGKEEQYFHDVGAHYEEVVYHGTIDRVVEDEYGRWWVLDYKTARTFDTAKLATDPQITAYCWAAEQLFERPIEGMVYLQMKKSPPKPPRVTKRGISTAKNQSTTRSLYRKALIDYYGSVEEAPEANIQFLNTLAYEETAQGDAFIRYDLEPRSIHSKISYYKKVLAIGKDILDNNLYCYENPTRDCSWDCPFRDVCITMNEGGDWEYLLEEGFEKRNETMFQEVEKWQRAMFRKYPQLFAEEYNKHCTEGVSTVSDFITALQEDELTVEDFCQGSQQ